MTLVPDDASSTRYSIARDSNLAAGGYYMIYGTVSAANSCQNKYPVLVPSQANKQDDKECLGHKPVRPKKSGKH